MSGCFRLDVGHRRLSVPEAEREVERTIKRLRGLPGPQVLKIVHGRGRGPTGGIIRAAVREVLATMPDLLRVIPGERYGRFDPDTQEMRTACGHFPDSDLDRGNEGITLVWVK